MKPITNELLERYGKEYANDSAAHVLHAAMARTDLKELAFKPLTAAKLEGPFAIELKTHGITAQKKSGRCWFFATMNIMREVITEKLNLSEFKLSANYITFYDKLEKANNYLEMIIENADKPLSDRMMEYLSFGLGDGGYWDQAVDLVQKYGVVPEYVMPETFQAENTSSLLGVLNTLMKKDAAILRRKIAAGEDVTALKEDMLGEIYKALCIAFGAPVQKFDFCYRDKEGNYHVERDLTPKAFYDKYVGLELDNYITVHNEPTDRVPMHKAFTFHFFGNMADKDCLSLNLPIDEFQELCVKQLKDNEPIWFACDSDKYGDRQLGIWDPNCFDYGGLLGGLNLDFSKEDRLNYKDTHGCHAMILVGVNFDAEGNPDRWKIENSWGGDLGKNGYFVCSQRYFEEYVLEAIINKKHLTDAQKAMLNEEPIRIAPWQTY